MPVSLQVLSLFLVFISGSDNWFCIAGFSETAFRAAEP